MIVLAPQQKKFTAAAKAALSLKGMTARGLAKELGVHRNSVWAAIKYGMNPDVLARVCARLEIQPPKE